MRVLTVRAALDAGVLPEGGVEDDMATWPVAAREAIEAGMAAQTPTGATREVTASSVTVENGAALFTADVRVTR